MDIEQDAELDSRKNTTKSNRPHYEKSKNLSNDTPDKVNVRHDNKRQKNDQMELNYFKMKTYGKSNKTEEIKPQEECAKLRLSQSNKTPTVNLTHNSNSSSASSSEDGVFQTRYSILDKHDNETTDNLNDNVPNLIEKNSDDEYFSMVNSSGNILNTKTSPIIIETKAYKEKKYPVIDKQVSEMKEHRETSLLKETKRKTKLRDCFTAESLNTDIKNNSDQVLEDNLNPDFYSYHNISTEESNKKCIKNMIVDVSVAPKQYLARKNMKNPTAVHENDIIEDIFNGTFDVTEYEVVSPETTKFSKQSENKLKSVTRTNEGKKNSKRKIDELATTNKRMKHEILESKNKKSRQKTREEAKELNKKPPKKESNDDKNFNSYQTSNTFLDKIKPQQKKRKDKFDSFNININFLGLTDSPLEKRQKKLKNYLRKYEDKNTYGTEDNNIQNKYSRRKTRSSSLIASRKIKEIEKIENSQDLDEEIITIEDSDKEHDDLFNTHLEHDKMETLHSLRGNSHTFKTKTASKNRKKENYQNKNSEISMEFENDFGAMVEREDFVQGSEINKIDARHTDDKQNSRPIIHLLKSPHCSKISTKQNASNDDKNNRASSQNSFYRYMANVDQNLIEDNNFEKSKIDTEFKNSDLTHRRSRIFMGANSQTEDRNNFTASKECTKKSKHKTWEMLENELLKDLEDQQAPDNVCKTVILKKQETVMKKEVAKNRNLFTVSNTSMLHTISKSKTGNKYNLKYEIQNTKSKFVGPKTDQTYDFMNTTVEQQMISKDSYFKSNNIVNKTIAAMEKCAAKFIAPEMKPSNADCTVNNWHIGKLSANSDTHQEAQYHSHMTSMVHDDKCYSNKIIGYTQKSNKVPKSCDFHPEVDMPKAINNLSKTQRNKRGSYKALCAENSCQSNKNNLPLEYLQSSINYDKTQALVPYGRERNNPWEKLIDKLHLQEDYQSSDKETSIEMKDQNTESLVIRKTITQHSKNLERNEMLLIQTDYEVKKTKLAKGTLSDQQFPAEVECVTEKSGIHMSENKNFSLMENITSGNINSQSTTEEISALENSDISRNLELQETSNKNKMPKGQLLNTVNKNKIKSPSFKFKLNKHGALKLRKHSTSGSSSSKISEDSSKLKKTKLHEKKSSECNSSATNKARNKYKIYLKKLLNSQNTANHEDDKTKPVKDITASNKSVLKEPLDKSPESLRKTKDSLIARQEDDIFSLSSSDESSDTSEKNYGSGPMCELFDE